MRKSKVEMKHSMRCISVLLLLEFCSIIVSGVKFCALLLEFTLSF